MLFEKIISDELMKYLQHEPTAFSGATLIAGGLVPGQDGSVQYSNFPLKKAPFASTSVAHQGAESPSMVVHVLCFLPLKVNGKTQLPQVPDPELEVVVATGPVVGAGVVGAEVDPGAEVVPDSQPTQVSAGSAEGGWQVVSPVS